MSNLITNMRAARSTPHIALQQYLILRSKATKDFVCVFEGADDYPYYDTIFRRIRDGFSYQPLIVKGKDQVLGLRELLSKRTDPESSSVAYFIDKDFDGYKGHQPSPNLYCTHGYSIENNLCNLSALQDLLLSAYECLHTEDQANIPKIRSMVTQRLDEFYTLMAKPNRIIFYARKNNIRLTAIENQITKYINITLDSVTATSADVLKLIGWPENTDDSFIPNHIPEFESLNASQDWRGKFLFGVYLELLNKLKDDRCSKTPKFFSKKNGIKFNPKGDVIRTLAILSPIPSCLRAFSTSLACSTPVTSTLALVGSEA